MATSLESQLIRGAGRAVAYDPEGLVAAAQDAATTKITSGLTAIGTKLAEKKKERELEEEKLQKEQDDIVKGHTDDFNAIKKQRIDDGGLGMNAWSEATDLAEKEKVIHDACPTGQEGNRCRQESRMRLTNMSKKWTGANEKLDAIVTMDDNPDIEASAYGTDSDTGRNNLAIRGGLSDENMTSRMKNDDEITELRESLKSVSPEEQMGIEQEIEALEKSNDLEVGWDIPGHGFISESDDRLSNLQTNVANDVKLHVTKRTTEQKENNWDKYIDGSGGEPYDENKSIAAHESAIDPDNITSIYYDKVTGTKKSLKENLKEHPMLKGASYKDLGIDEELDFNTDGIIDDNEIANVIEALSDPEHGNYDFETSKAVAADYMAKNELMEYNKHLFGTDFYELSTAEKNTRISERTTQDPGQSDAEYLAEGGVKGIQKGMDMIWDPVLQRSVQITRAKTRKYSGTASELLDKYL